MLESRSSILGRDEIGRRFEAALFLRCLVQEKLGLCRIARRQLAHPHPDQSDPERALGKVSFLREAAQSRRYKLISV